MMRKGPKTIDLIFLMKINYFLPLSMGLGVKPWKTTYIITPNRHIQYGSKSFMLSQLEKHRFTSSTVRDLHWGNVLVGKKTEKSLKFFLEGKEQIVQTHVP